MQHSMWHQADNNNDLRRFLVRTLSELRTQNPYTDDCVVLADTLSKGIKATGYIHPLDMSITPPKSPSGQYGIGISLVSPINNVQFSFSLSV